MSYRIGQFTQSKIEPSTAGVPKYSSYITTGTAALRQKSADSGVQQAYSITFQDSCVKGLGLERDNYYYFHGKIKQQKETSQIFYVYLVNYDKTDSLGEEKTQYVKTIEVSSGLGWCDVEFMFNPVKSFDCILFELQRTIYDYQSEGGRVPIICYEELSLINNVLTGDYSSLVKFGIQTRPGLLMNINGEEIHVGRSGVYELKNGSIMVESFSVVSAAIDEKVNGVPFSEYLDGLTESDCIFAEGSGRVRLKGVDAFVVDYMVREED